MGRAVSFEVKESILELKKLQKRTTIELAVLGGYSPAPHKAAFLHRQLIHFSVHWSLYPKCGTL